MFVFVCIHVCILRGGLTFWVGIGKRRRIDDMCRILYRLHNCTLHTQEVIKMETSDVVMVIQATRSVVATCCNGNSIAIDYVF